MATTKKRGPKNVTAAHKAAMQAGRQESKVVREYLEALEAHKPKRGRKRTAESVQRRLDVIDSEIDHVDALTRLELTQERFNLAAELEVRDAGDTLHELEAAFVEVALQYSERKGITYHAWREVGVDPSVLKQAGIGRSTV